MTLTLNISEALAQRLEFEAQALDMTVEEYSLRLLDRSAPLTDSAWGTRNQRRVELLRRSLQTDLSATEQAELDTLEAELNEQFEAFDRGLLSRLDELKHDVAALAKGDK